LRKTYAQTKKTMKRS